MTLSPFHRCHSNVDGVGLGVTVVRALGPRPHKIGTETDLHLRVREASLRKLFRRSLRCRTSTLLNLTPFPSIIIAPNDSQDRNVALPGVVLRQFVHNI